jgi:hypothetical protein
LLTFLLGIAPFPGGTGVVIRVDAVQRLLIAALQKHKKRKQYIKETKMHHYQMKV